MEEEIKGFIGAIILLVRSKWLLYNMERQRKKCEQILDMAKKQKIKADKAYNDFKSLQKKYCG